MKETYRRVLVDVDSGTVFNGPVYEIIVDADELEAILESDDEARNLARRIGRILA